MPSVVRQFKVQGHCGCSCDCSHIFQFPLGGWCMITCRSKCKDFPAKLQPCSERTVIKACASCLLMPLYGRERLFWQCSGSNPWSGPVRRWFRFYPSSELLFKCVPSFSGPLYPLPCIEILLLWAELIKRLDSEQNCAPRTRCPGTPWHKLTTHHRALWGRPAPTEGQTHTAPLPCRYEPFVWEFCFVFQGKGSLCQCSLPTSSCAGAG